MTGNKKLMVCVNELKQHASEINRITRSAIKAGGFTKEYQEKLKEIGSDILFLGVALSWLLDPIEKGEE